MCIRDSPYLERLAQQVWTNGHAQLVEDSRAWSAQDLAGRLFVTDEARFLEAHQAHALDMMEHLTEFHGRYPVTLKPTAEAKTAMKAAMASHFRETAFGARCQVEDFANDEKFALFIFHEDEVAPFDRFNDRGVVEPDWQRPVVRLAAVFQFETSTLLVKAPRVAEREKHSPDRAGQAVAGLGASVLVSGQGEQDGEVRAVSYTHLDVYKRQGNEFIGQFLFALQLCWFPMLVSTVAFGFGAPGLQAANFLSLFGALDRLSLIHI